MMIWFRIRYYYVIGVVSMLLVSNPIKASGSIRVVLNCIPTLEGNSILSGDSILVYTAENDTVYIDSTDFPHQISGTWGSQADTSGLVTTNSDQLGFQFLLAADGCKTSLVDYTAYDTVVGGIPMRYISSITAHRYTVNLPVHRACSDGEPVSIISNLPENSFRSYSETGLRIDSQNVLVPQSSNPGTYSIRYESEYCLQEKSATFRIVDNPRIHYAIQDKCDSVLLVAENQPSGGVLEWNRTAIEGDITLFRDTIVDLKAISPEGCIAEEHVNIQLRKLKFLDAQYEKHEADCWMEGAINLESFDVENLVGNHQVQVRNAISHRVVSDLTMVPEGLYRIQLIDDRNCVAEYGQDITVLQRCLDDYPVFTPNGDAVEDEYFIPHEGNVEIINREGILVRKLVTPNYWDGRDGSGNVLPMGNYLICTDTGRTVNITLVR